MNVTRPPMVLGSVALTALLVCAGCGSSAPTSTSVGTLQKQLLSITKSTNAQLTKDNSASHPALTDTRYAAAFHHAAVQFAALKFPASMKADQKALVTALDIMSTDATATGVAAAKNQNVEANVTRMAQLNLKLIEEEKVEKTAADALRDDLGLPPEPTTTVASTPSTQPPNNPPA